MKTFLFYICVVALSAFGIVLLFKTDKPVAQDQDHVADPAAPAPLSKWKRIEADNGAVYAIDMTSISRSGNQADAVICTVENDACEIMNMHRWIFYCAQNRFTELTDAGFPPSMYAPPLSLGREVLDIACGR